MGPYYDYQQWTLYHFDRTRAMEQEPWMRDLPQDIARDLAAGNRTAGALSKARSSPIRRWLKRLFFGLPSAAAKRSVTASAK